MADVKVNSVTIGVDVGQRVDPTAIAVCERQGDRYMVRHLERLTLGTRYPEVAARVGQVYHNALNRQLQAIYRDAIAGKAEPTWPQACLASARATVWLLIDATGVGTPVIDLIREEGDLQDARLTGCFFTGGDKMSVHRGSHEGSVGKAYLVSRLQALIESQRIRLPRTPEARALADELLDYEIRVTEDANVTAGAFKVGAHDDMVTALGLACLVDETTYKCGATRYA